MKKEEITAELCFKLLATQSANGDRNEKLLLVILGQLIKDNTDLTKRVKELEDTPNEPVTFG